MSAVLPDPEHSRALARDTQLCISLAARPSNIGTRFHNYLYNALDLNYAYKAFAPRDIAQAVAGIRGLPIRGAAVSMPYKEAVIDLVDVMEPSAAAIDSVNTIVNDGASCAPTTPITKPLRTCWRHPNLIARGRSRWRAAAEWRRRW